MFSPRQHSDGVIFVLGDLRTAPSGNARKNVDRKQTFFAIDAS